MNDLESAADIASVLPRLTAARKIAGQMMGRGATAGELERAAKDFEAVLMGRLFEEMRKTIPESGLFESPMSKQIDDMFWFYLSQDLGAKGGIGVWKEIYRQISETVGHVPGEPVLEQLI